MNQYVQMRTDELINRYVDRGLNDADRLIRLAREELNEINAEADKLGLLTAVLEANELEYQNHLKTCTNKKSCDTNKRHLKVETSALCRFR